MNPGPTVTLSSLDDIKRHFAENAVPCYFVSATNFNLMGMHDWVKEWHNVNLLDCFDGKHPGVLLVEDNHERVFEDIEDINKYLLHSAKARQLFDAHKASGKPPGNVILLFFDEDLEALCESLGLEIILPKNRLVREIDSKIVTTEIGNQVGVSSVPNVLTKVSSYQALVDIAKKAGLGKRWVIQTAYGDSGKTTFFIASEKDYSAVAKKIEKEDMVKVMRWVNCTGTAIEACATRWGTFVGPLLTELIGQEALTPYPGGWCGNELYDAAFTLEMRKQVLEKTRAIGDALYRRGYRGYFELDYLIDQDSQDVYLGELNARITGITAMTNMSDFSSGHIPLFLFHLLEYDKNIDLKLDVDAFNQSMLLKGASGTASQLILKYTDEALKIITQAPVSGVYTMGSDGRLALKQAGYSRRDALAEDEAYILRIMTVGEYAYKGGDLAIMFMNRVIREPQGKLNETGDRWVRSLKRLFQFRGLSQEERSMVEIAHNPANVKGGRDQ